MHTPDDDLVVIEDFCRRAAVAAVADLIRAEGGQLVLRSAPRAEIESPTTPIVRHVTVTPVTEWVDERSWWERVDKLMLALKVVGVLVALGLMAGVAMVIQAAIVAMTAAVVSVVPIVVGLIVLVLLLGLLRGGGGGGFSGTFSGRMH